MNHPNNKSLEKAVAELSDEEFERLMSFEDDDNYEEEPSLGSWRDYDDGTDY